MAKLRKMLGSADAPGVVALMRQMETQSRETLARWSAGYAPLRDAARQETAPAVQAALRAIGTAAAVMQTPTNALGMTFYAAAALAYHTLGEGADAAAYDYRIYHCDFINGNNGDRDISANRPVYASGNYLDHPADNQVSKHNADLSLRYLSPSGLAGYLLYSFGYSDTAAPAPDWGAARLGVGAEAESVTLDAADELLFPDGLLLDGASFDGRGTDLELAVQNEEGNEVGTWIFAAESEAAQ